MTDMAGIFKSYQDVPDGGPSPVFYIPERLDGEPVTEIGERAFYGCRWLERVVIPETVERIGAYAFAECRSLEHVVFPPVTRQVGDYAFYNCMALKAISFGAQLSAIGYGAFKNCLELSSIDMEIVPGRINGLNSILQDEFQAVDVTIRYPGGSGMVQDQARLVFTDYQYEYVPEIEARQFNWETYGSGDSYRISIGDRDIDYEKYDSVFPLAMVEDDGETLFKIAAGRLCWPHRLSEKSRKRYEDYIRSHMDDILERIMAAGEQDARGSHLLRYMIERGLLTEPDMGRALDLAGRYGRTQMTALLMGGTGMKPGKKPGSIREKFAL